MHQYHKEECANFCTGQNWKWHIPKHWRVPFRVSRSVGSFLQSKRTDKHRNECKIRQCMVPCAAAWWERCGPEEMEPKKNLHWVNTSGWMNIKRRKKFRNFPLHTTWLYCSWACVLLASSGAACLQDEHSLEWVPAFHDNDAQNFKIRDNFCSQWLKTPYWMQNSKKCVLPP